MAYSPVQTPETESSPPRSRPPRGASWGGWQSADSIAVRSAVGAITPSVLPSTQHDADKRPCSLPMEGFTTMYRASRKYAYHTFTDLMFICGGQYHLGHGLQIAGWLKCSCNSAWQCNWHILQALERIAGLLEGSSGSIVLAERGDSVAVQRHPNFRLLAAMNPATDAGESLQLDTVSLKNEFKYQSGRCYNLAWAFPLANRDMR